MSGPTLEQEILNQVSRLSEPERRQVLRFAKSLAGAIPMGEPGSDLLRLVGCIPPEDLKEITEAIEEDCERVDHSGW